MSLVEILQATISADAGQRQEALNLLQKAVQENITGLLSSISDIVSDLSCPAEIRMTALVFIKNTIGSLNKLIRKTNAAKWFSIPEENRISIKKKIFSAYGTEGRSPSMVAQCVSTIAVVELPNGQWMDIIPSLIEKFNNPQSNEECRRAILDTIGYICEDINYNILVPYSSSILTLIVEGASKKYGLYVQISANNALLNSLDSAVNNFNKQDERNFLMELICNNTQDENPQVRVLALKCLCRVVKLYYELLDVYMNSIFQITIQAMNSEDENIILQGIEFWCCVCDEEYYILRDCQEGDLKSVSLCKNYALGALPTVIPIILNKIMLSYEDEDTEFNITPVISSRVCLKLFSALVGDKLIDIAMPFVRQGFDSPEWSVREAVCMVVGCLLEGPDQSYALSSLKETLKPLLDLSKDPCVAVRDTAIWALGRFYEQIPYVLNEEYLLKNVIACGLENLDSPQRVSKNAFWMLSCVFAATEEIYILKSDDRPDTNALSPYYLTLMEELLKRILVNKSVSSVMRTLQFESLIELIKVYPSNMYHLIPTAFQTIFNNIGSLVASADKSDIYTMISLFCAFLQVIFRTLHSPEISEIFSIVIQYLLSILSTSENVDNAEDIFFTISIILSQASDDAVKSSFPLIKPYIIQGLKSIDQPQLFVSISSVIEEALERIGEAFVSEAPEFMELFLAAFNSISSNDKVKSQVLSSFGDIAMAIGPHFKPYLDVALTACIKGVPLFIPLETTDSDDLDDYFECQACVLSAFSAIIQSVCQPNERSRETLNEIEKGPLHVQNYNIINHHARSIIDSIRMVVHQPVPYSAEVLKKVFGVVGDFICVMKGIAIEMVFDSDLFSAMLNQSYRFEADEFYSSIEWVQGLIKSFRT